MPNGGTIRVARQPNITISIRPHQIKQVTQKEVKPRTDQINSQGGQIKEAINEGASRNTPKVEFDTFLLIIKASNLLAFGSEKSLGCRAGNYIID